MWAVTDSCAPLLPLYFLAPSSDCFGRMSSCRERHDATGPPCAEQRRGPAARLSPFHLKWQREETSAAALQVQELKLDEASLSAA